MLKALGIDRYTERFKQWIESELTITDDELEKLFGESPDIPDEPSEPDVPEETTNKLGEAKLGFLKLG